MSKQWIVVEDPENEYWEGSLVPRERAGQLETRGVTLLPVNPDLFRHTGVAGYSRRAWGSGWPASPSTPRVVAPITLYCVTSMGIIHWAAKLRFSKEWTGLGTLRFIADQSQSMPTRVSAASSDPVNLKGASVEASKDEHDGCCVVRGKIENIAFPSDGFYGFALYGFAPDLSVVWTAATQAVE